AAELRLREPSRNPSRAVYRNPLAPDQRQHADFRIHDPGRRRRNPGAHSQQRTLRAQRLGPAGYRTLGNRSGNAQAIRRDPGRDPAQKRALIWAPALTAGSLLLPSAATPSATQSLHPRLSIARRDARVDSPRSVSNASASVQVRDRSRRYHRFAGVRASSGENQKRTTRRTPMNARKLATIAALPLL